MIFCRCYYKSLNILMMLNKILIWWFWVDVTNKARSAKKWFLKLKLNIISFECVNNLQSNLLQHFTNCYNILQHVTIFYNMLQHFTSHTLWNLHIGEEATVTYVGLSINFRLSCWTREVFFFKITDYTIEWQLHMCYTSYWIMLWVVWSRSRFLSGHAMNTFK